MTAEIAIPEAKPSPRRRSTPSDDYDEGFITLAEAETAAQATGQHRGMTVEFSDDGVTWVEAWLPTLGDDGEPIISHPSHARAVVNRKLADGDVVKTQSIVRWDEYVPGQDSDRYENWMKMPTTLLGKCAKVSCYRGAFRDVIGNRYEPAEFDQVPNASAEKASLS